jgi:hypothetical protein
MKKFLLLTVLILTLTASCTRDYTCECNIVRLSNVQGEPPTTSTRTSYWTAHKDDHEESIEYCKQGASLTIGELGDFHNCELSYE